MLNRHEKVRGHMMTRRILFSSLVVSLASLPLMATDPSVYNMVMSDAKVLIGLDMDRVAKSGIGQQLMSRLDLDTGDFRKMMDATGFDPRRDLREVLVASTGEPGHQGSLIIVRGAFDESRLAALTGVHGGTVQSYQGFRILSGKGGNAGKAMEKWVGFLGNSLIVAGGSEEVKAAIDRHRSSALLEASMASRIQAASTRYDAWMISTTSPASLTRQAPTAKSGKAMQVELLQAIESFSGGMRLGADNIDLTAEALTRSEKDAAALVDVFTFLIQMAAGNQMPDSPMGRMLDSMKTSVEGRTAKFQFTAPGQEILKLLDLARQTTRVKAVSTQR
jgi:hypothetical protein